MYARLYSGIRPPRDAEQLDAVAELAGECDVDVTGLTLSVEQHKLATERAAAAGLSDRVRFHLRDYREETGTYDRIVSVGMFEHVGILHFQDFFNTVKGLLEEDGVVRLPAGLSFEEGATLPCAGVTAWHALVEIGNIKAGDSVLVLGSGGVSIYEGK